jgi:hypothetical protein
MRFADYEALYNDFAAQKVHPADLKMGVAVCFCNEMLQMNCFQDFLDELLSPIRDGLATNDDFQRITREAYPSAESAKAGVAAATSTNPKKQKENKKHKQKSTTDIEQAVQSMVVADS